MQAKKGFCSSHLCSILLVLLTLQAINAAVPPPHSGSKLSNEVEKRWKFGRVHLHQRRSVDPVKRLEDSDGDYDYDGNCSDINDYPSDLYNNSCQVVKQECGDSYELFNYLEFVTCDVGKGVGYVFLLLWLMYLLLLLSTTVDNFFVPVLQLLSNKLKLPPSIAGMTLLALGNGAPDIFVAFSALQDDDVALMLGALMGAGLFITSVIVGTVLIVSPTKSYNINPVDYLRDVIAYVLVLVLIVVVAYDGKVTLAEAICFPLLYILYIAVVVALTYLKKQLVHYSWFKKIGGSQKIKFNKNDETVVFSKTSFTASQQSRKSQQEQETTIDEGSSESVEKDDKVKSVKTPPPPKKEKKKKLVLVGLTVPSGIFSKIQFVLLWPFSFLRWLTIPPCYHDGQWSVFHFIFAVASPIPMALFLLIIAKKWEGLIMLVNGVFPVSVIIILCVSPLSAILFIVLSRKNPPHWIMQWILLVLAFAMSIAWLKVIADEVVTILQALGLLSGISTAILGLTVLAIGNSVADWVADVAVTLKGSPEMGLASCFGAPLITSVMGISFALLTKIAENGGESYLVPITSHEFVHVKLAWIFLSIVLLPSVGVFMVFKFNPPKEFGLVLMYVYIVFMLFSILIETNTLNITL